MDKKLKTVTSLKYLGSNITDEGSKSETLSRIAQTTTALTRLKPGWNNRSISLSSTIRLMHSLVTSVFLYACESWTLTAELQIRIRAIEMRRYQQDTTHVIQRPCHQRGKHCQDPAGNRTARRPFIQRRKLKWYGHVSRHQV